MVPNYSTWLNVNVLHLYYLILCCSFQKTKFPRAPYPPLLHEKKSRILTDLLCPSPQDQCWLVEQFGMVATPHYCNFHVDHMTHSDPKSIIWKGALKCWIHFSQTPQIDSFYYQNLMHSAQYVWATKRHEWIFFYYAPLSNFQKDEWVPFFDPVSSYYIHYVPRFGC